MVEIECLACAWTVRAETQLLAGIALMEHRMHDHGDASYSEEYQLLKKAAEAAK